MSIRERFQEKMRQRGRSDYYSNAYRNENQQYNPNWSPLLDHMWQIENQQTPPYQTTPQAPQDDPAMDREMQFLKEGSNRTFDDARAYQTADLDAFKLMQLQPEYGAPVEADINTTEGGRLSLLRRMMFADAALEDPRLPQAMTRLDNSVAGKMGALGRLYTDDNYELGRLMADQFANAVLRNDSGAQAPEPEVQRYMRQFFPLPNETQAQLDAKKALRRETMRSLVQALGGDAAPAVQQLIGEIDALKQQADVPDGSLTGQGEISTEDQDFLRSLGIN